MNNNCVKSEVRCDLNEMETTDNLDTTPHKRCRKKRSKKVKKTIGQSLVHRLKNLHIHENSDGTEDGIETESDLLCNDSFSEAGEDGDIEDSFTSCNKDKSKKTSKSCGVKSDDDLVVGLDPFSVVVDGYQNYCQECTLYEDVILRNFRWNTSPFKKERFEDRGTLADVEDFEESDKSDREYEWKPNWRYIYRYLN